MISKIEKCGNSTFERIFHSTLKIGSANGIFVYWSKISATSSMTETHMMALLPLDIMQYGKVYTCFMISYSWLQGEKGSLLKLIFLCFDYFGSCTPNRLPSYPLSNLTIYYEGYLKNILWGSKKYKKISSKHIEYFANLYRMRIKYLESMVKDQVHFILCNIWSMSKSEQWQYAVTARFSLSKCFSRGHRNKFPWKNNMIF